MEIIILLATGNIIQLYSYIIPEAFLSTKAAKDVKTWSDLSVFIDK